jgi:hypothetical protein
MISYGLDCWDSNPGRRMNFSLHSCILTGHEAHRIPFWWVTDITWCWPHTSEVVNNLSNNIVMAKKHQTRDVSNFRRKIGCLKANSCVSMYLLNDSAGSSVNYASNIYWDRVQCSLFVLPVFIKINLQNLESRCSQARGGGFHYRSVSFLFVNWSRKYNPVSVIIRNSVVASGVSMDMMIRKQFPYLACNRTWPSRPYEPLHWLICPKSPKS